jgi:hypothetical protein
MAQNRFCLILATVFLPRSNAITTSLKSSRLILYEIHGRGVGIVGRRGEVWRIVNEGGASSSAAGPP